MYEVWMTQGQGDCLVETFDTLDEAITCAQEGIDNKEGSFGIKYSGTWIHKWEKIKIDKRQH